MQSSSTPAHRGCVTWQGRLLAVLLLTFWNLHIAAQLTVGSVPPNGIQGKDILLLVSNLPANRLGYVWYKGDRVEPKLQIASYIINISEITPGTVYSGREKIYADGSLLFQNATPGDTGYYTLQVIKRTLLTEVGTGQLHVYKPVSKPSIRVSIGHKDPNQGK
ncbi:carcinoembryonic antigen-related cell adhesion molecule 6-like [Equus quagga]|uniref:carcinoembryonic antigen-related cell adhesion molecule 6-like n=1 Tax=Equus quagga TaxID=89248 RepID=UPI001EE19FE0|nr:carcinoembryonic antigen-related cell adhesion molecule 6-like [Equus quagga]